ncbi:MAG: DUF3999 domain-containing protein [Firmicutes bacterium]|nr:DUF3999 domain-containing protein [Bacillota bacterium]
MVISVMAMPVMAAFNVSQWPKYCTVEPGDTTKGYVMAELSGPVYEAAFEDLRDVRVAQAAAGNYMEVPYDVVSRPDVPRETRLSASLINRGTIGKRSTATVYLGSSVSTHNHLRINTGSHDFIKVVTLEGSDDRTTWTKIGNSGKIADFSSAGQVFQRTDITYDPVDYRYLRVTLSGGTGEVVDITGIDVLFTDIKAGTEKGQDLRIVSQEVSPKDNSSIIVLTSGFANFPVHKVGFNVQSSNFSRPAVVYGSPDMKEWLPVGEGTLAAFSLADYSESQLTLPVNAPGYRYLKVVVRNGDSSPIRFGGAKGYYFPRYILFPVKPGSQYGIYFGNRTVNAPDYDLSSFSQKVLDTNPPVWQLSSPQANPLYKETPKVVPESEKHKWLLPGILTILVAGLALFIFRSLPKVMKNDL